VNRWLRLVIVGAAMSTASGCLVFVKAPSSPPPIRLRAEQPFTLYVANEISGALEAHCRVERIDGSVLAIRGDTLLLNRIAVRKASPLSPSCAKASWLYVRACCCFQCPRA